MALSTFSELKTSIANYLNRDDLSSVIPDFITLTENRINRELRARANVTRVTATTTSGTDIYDFPADLIELRSVSYVSGSNKNALSYMTPESGTREYGTTANGSPKAYSNMGKAIKLSPTPDAAYTIELIYYSQIASLSDSRTTNNILAEFPSLYLYGACLEGAIFLNDSDEITRFDAIFNRTLVSIRESEEKARYGGNVMTMTVQGDPGSLVRRGA
jgi:hypothetical protein